MVKIYALPLSGNMATIYIMTCAVYRLLIHTVITFEEPDCINKSTHFSNTFVALKMWLQHSEAIKTFTSIGDYTRQPHLYCPLLKKKISENDYIQIEGQRNTRYSPTCVYFFKKAVDHYVLSEAKF